jgi:hypothetical protein
LAYGSNIFGGWIATLGYSSGYNDNSVVTNVGVVTRVTPRLDPSNINIRGTGERGLYDILLGMRDPRLTVEFLITDDTFISTYQSGTTGIAFLHLRFTGTTDGVTLVNAKVNTLSCEGEHNNAIRLTIEFWGGGSATYPTGIIQWNGVVPTQTWGARVTTPLRWLDSVVSIAASTESAWWSWRYEVNNNLQRLGNVSTGGTRDLKVRQRDVTGLIVIDLEDLDEYGTLADISSEMAKFNITINLDGTDLLNCDNCRWGILEAPFGPEDLIAKRFPFTATDLTTFTP